MKIKSDFPLLFAERSANRERNSGARSHLFSSDGRAKTSKDSRAEGVVKEKSKGLKESKKTPQKSLKKREKWKKEKRNR